MSITTYSDLQTEVLSNASRSDLSSQVATFIQLCEADMQRRLKLVDFENTANVTVTAGSGALPTDFAGHRAAMWDADEDRALRYVTPDRFNALVDSVALPTYYTVVGTNLKVKAESTGTVVLTYNARFTALSNSNSSNSILATYPDAYFFGTLKHLYHHTRNWAAKAEQEKEFERAVAQIVKDHKERKYPGPLEVRPR